jgi:hypothetical protein
MYRWLFIAAGLLSASCAAAQGRRPDTLQMTCRQAAGLVHAQGSIVLGTGPDIYDRYSTGCGFCPDMSYLAAAFLRTADNPQCFVGYRCANEPSPVGSPSCGFTGYRGP